MCLFPILIPLILNVLKSPQHCSVEFDSINVLNKRFLALLIIRLTNQRSGSREVSLRKVVHENKLKTAVEGRSGEIREREPKLIEALNGFNSNGK